MSNKNAKKDTVAKSLWYASKPGPFQDAFLSAVEELVEKHEKEFKGKSPARALVSFPSDNDTIWTEF